MREVQQNVTMMWTFNESGVRLIVDFAANEMTAVEFMMIADRLRVVLDGEANGDPAGEQDPEAEAPASGDQGAIEALCDRTMPSSLERSLGVMFRHASGAEYNAAFVRVK